MLQGVVNVRSRSRRACGLKPVDRRHHVSEIPIALDDFEPSLSFHQEVAPAIRERDVLQYRRRCANGMSRRTLTNFAAMFEKNDPEAGLVLVATGNHAPVPGLKDMKWKKATRIEDRSQRKNGKPVARAHAVPAIRVLGPSCFGRRAATGLSSAS